VGQPCGASTLTPVLAGKGLSIKSYLVRVNREFPAETIRSPPARRDPAVPPIRHLAWGRLSATAVRSKGGVDRPPHTVLSTMAVRLLSALALQKISPIVEMAAAEMARHVKAVLLAIAALVMDGVARPTTIV